MSSSELPQYPRTFKIVLRSATLEDLALQTLAWREQRVPGLEEITLTMLGHVVQGNEQRQLTTETLMDAYDEDRLILFQKFLEAVQLLLLNENSSVKVTKLSVNVGKGEVPRLGNQVFFAAEVSVKNRDELRSLLSLSRPNIPRYLVKTNQPETFRGRKPTKPRNL